jgi:hypothetical protein
MNISLKIDYSFESYPIEREHSYKTLKILIPSMHLIVINLFLILDFPEKSDKINL